MKNYTIKEKISAIFELSRPWQYYKNLVVFLAIFFSGNILTIGYFSRAAAGFIALCLMSSVNYIINDYTDRKNDRFNSEKSSRPLASGKISPDFALSSAFLLFLLSLSISYFLGYVFFAAVLAFFCISSLYSLFFKNEIFLDLISISINFVLRAVAGAFAINVWISPWLIVGTFFLSLFLACGKRKSEIMLLTSKSKSHRAVLADYSEKTIDLVLSATTSLLLMSYALYCFLGNYELLLLTLPIVTYIIFRYIYIIYSGSDIARFPHRFVKDYRMTFAVFIYFMLAFIVIYYKNIIWI